LKLAQNFRSFIRLPGEILRHHQTRNRQSESLMFGGKIQLPPSHSAAKWPLAEQTGQLEEKKLTRAFKRAIFQRSWKQQPFD